MKHSCMIVCFQLGGGLTCYQKFICFQEAWIKGSIWKGYNDNFLPFSASIRNRPWCAQHIKYRLNSWSTTMLVFMEQEISSPTLSNLSLFGVAWSSKAPQTCGPVGPFPTCYSSMLELVVKLTFKLSAWKGESVKAQASEAFKISADAGFINCMISFGLWIIRSAVDLIQLWCWAKLEVHSIDI